jgi:DNA-binding transcriptional LysR family regulator
MRSATPPIASAADLERHVLLELETSLNGRPWYDWQQWLDRIGMRRLRAAQTLRFSHYDQVVAAAVSGAGIAIGKWPHLATHLHEGALVAPLGTAGVARIGAFYVIAGDATRGSVSAFLAWLRSEAEQETQRREKWSILLRARPPKRRVRIPSEQG